MNSPLKSLLATALTKNQLAVTPSQLSQLVQYLKLIQKWNRVINLTSLIEDEEMVNLHIIDSLMVLPYLNGNRHIDIGSGAGLPGIPLAIMQPEKHWTLLDKSSKKSHFLVQVIAELGLTHVEVINKRVQEFHPSHCFDSILSRAFTDLGQFLAWTAHLLCRDGVFIAMKGKFPEKEIAELPTQFTLGKTIRVDIHGLAIERHILCFHCRA